MSIEELESSYSGSGPGLDRTPPQDIAAEMSVLGGMLLSKDAIADVIEQIRSNDFYRPAHEVIYEAIIDLYGRGEPADAITVVAELQRRGEHARVGGAPYIHDLMAGVPTAANAGYYARIVRERAIMRRLVEAGTRIVQMGYATDGGEVDDVVNTAQAEVYAVTERRASEDFLPLADIIGPTFDEIDAAQGRGEGLTGVPTGYSDFDRLTNGLHPGQMVVVAARPAVGKSVLGINVASHAAVHHNMASVIFSLEMSRNEIVMRMLAAEARVPLTKMRSGHMDDGDWQKLAATMGKVSDAPLFIDDSPNMSLMEIRAKCRRLKQRHDLKLVVIDYLQLMSSGKRVESRQQEVSEFSRALKLLAKELEVPVIAISQLNRSAEQRTDKKPQMSDLRESGCLTGNTRILRADTGAETTMDELYALNAKEIPVWALNDRLQYVRRHLTHVFPTGTKPVFRLRLASGKEIEATANHPFLTYEGWSPLEELTVGSRIGVPRHVPGPEQHTAWDDREVVMLTNLLSNDSFGQSPHAQWVDDLGLFGLSSDEKLIPANVFCLPKQQIALFLKHLWATDGSVTVNENGLNGLIRYTSTSRKFVDGLSRLLLRFGISTRRQRAAVKGANQLGFALDISEEDDQLRFLQEIGVRGDAADGEQLLQIIRKTNNATTIDTVPHQVWEDVRNLLNDEGLSEFRESPGTHSIRGDTRQGSPSRQRLAQVADVLEDEELEIMAVNDLLWDEVAAIEPLGELPVFDATVRDTHNFIANGIAVHNSIEQDADVVILLHREDAYEKESPRAGEADFIVAKHRNGPTDVITVAFQGHYQRFVDMQV